MSDFLILLVAKGLQFHFCETSICIKLKDDEIPADQLPLVKRNEELMEEHGFWAQSAEERKAKGYTPDASRLVSNDELIDPLSERIAATVLD